MERNRERRRPRLVEQRQSGGQIARRKRKAKRGKAKAAAKKTRSKKNGRGSHSPITAKDLAKLAGARRAKQPTEFKPQLATLASRVPAGDDWLHELKFDGYRALALFENGKVRLISRNGNDWTARFHAVADALGDAPDQERHSRRRGCFARRERRLEFPAAAKPAETRRRRLARLLPVRRAVLATATT